MLWLFSFMVQVGNAFVNQYYNVLHQSPQVVHRFYTDASRLTRAEAGADGAVETVGTQRVRIHYGFSFTAIICRVLGYSF